MSKLTGKTKGDLAKFLIKSNQSNDGREAQADFDIGMTQEEAVELLSEDLAELAFSSMRKIVVPHDEGDSTELVHLQDTIKPGGKVVFENHVIKISGAKVEGQPRLLKFKTVQKADRVVARVRIDIPVDKASLIASLSERVGKTVALDFEPAQGDLPGVQ